MLFKSASLLFLGIGIFVLMQVISPFLSFKVWEIAAYYQNQVLADPSSSEKSQLADSNVLGLSVSNVGDFRRLYLMIIRNLLTKNIL